jgi:acyl-CoA synthetase (AMP-forming)/AMP-acid ligase II
MSSQHERDKHPLSGNQSLLSSLDQQWRQSADNIAFRFLAANGEETASLTYRQLCQRVYALANALHAQGCHGRNVVLLYPDGLDFVVGMLATLYAGATAVPLPLPRDFNSAQRIALCASDCDAHIVLSSQAALALLQTRLRQMGLSATLNHDLTWMTENDCQGFSTQAPPALTVTDQTIGLLQYTSGSTGDPKGVVITHGNLRANAGVIRAAFEHTPSLIGVGWLPLSHDMGLMGHVFQPLLVGGESILMSPISFIREPKRWLEAISKYRATTSGGPCFAFELACRRIPAASVRHLDLSSWSVAYCGAEPIRAESLEQFARQFAVAGFSRHALYPCYGLAESTLFVSGPTLGSGLTVDSVCSEPLSSGQVQRDPSGPQLRQVTNCGYAWPDHEIRIVDPDTREQCPADATGEIWVRGPSVAAGYWNRKEESIATFHATIADDSSQANYLRTGDLGYLANGSLYITGRLKDLLIVNGKNRHAEDIEAVARTADASLFSRRSAAFASHVSGKESAILVQEVNGLLAEGAWEQLAKQIQACLLREHGFVADDIVFVPNGAIPRTTSGKVRRRDCRRLYETQELPILRNVRSMMR